MSKDRFSTQSSAYAAFRPVYPDVLYEFLYSHIGSFDRAWDCGCGNGQVARVLSTKFHHVDATDISQGQLDHAYRAGNITYTKCGAEQTPFADNTFDLVTVAQALHWFDIPLFFTEAQRVTKPNGIIAVWGYSLLRITLPLDKLITHFYTQVIGPYWDKERSMVDDHYRSVSFPFDPIPVGDFEFGFEWTLDELTGYLSTWSAVQNYKIANGTDPVGPLQNELKLLWPNGKLPVKFPLFMLCGRNDPSGKTIRN